MNFDGQIVVYVDNTCLLFSNHYWDDLRQKAEYNFNKVLKWLNNKNLTLNFTKIMFLIFQLIKLYSHLKKYQYIVVQTRHTVIARKLV